MLCCRSKVAPPAGIRFGADHARHERADRFSSGRDCGQSMRVDQAPETDRRHRRTAGGIPGRIGYGVPEHRLPDENWAGIRSRCAGRRQVPRSPGASHRTAMASSSKRERRPHSVARAPRSRVSDWGLRHGARPFELADQIGGHGSSPVTPVRPRCGRHWRRVAAFRLTEVFRVDDRAGADRRRRVAECRQASAT